LGGFETGHHKYFKAPFAVTPGLQGDTKEGGWQVRAFPHSPAGTLVSL